MQSNVHGLINDGPCAWFGNGFYYFEVALKNEFNDFVIRRFEVGFFIEGSWGDVVGIEDHGDRVGGEVFYGVGENGRYAMAIGLDLSDVKIIE